jgi:hypothetical protein
MQIIDNLIKKAIHQSDNADQKSVLMRWSTLAAVLLLFWSFSALVINPILFSLTENNVAGSANILEISSQYLFLFFNPHVLFLLFSILAGMLLGFILVNDYSGTLFGKTTSKHSGSTLWKRVFGIPNNQLTRISDSKTIENDLRVLKKVGGPARIMVPAENAVLLENRNHQARIIGPTMNLPGMHFLMGNFESLIDVMNLQNQSLQFDLKAQTMDGQTLLIKNLQVVFSVLRDRKTTTLTRPYPFNPHSIFTIHYTNPPDPPQVKFANLLKYKLIEYARKFDSSEFQYQEIVIDSRISGKQSLESLPAIFKKRQKFSFIFHKPVHSFFQKHIRGKSRLPQRRITKIHRLYLELIISAKPPVSTREGRSSNIFSNFLNNFQIQVSPLIEKKGFQLHLLTFGTIEIEKRIENINTNFTKNIRADQSKEYFQAQATDLLEDLNKSNSIFSINVNKKENLQKILTLLEINLNTDKGKSNSRDWQLQNAIENISLLIKRQE